MVMVWMKCSILFQPPDDSDLNHFYDNGDISSLLFDSNLFHFPVRDGKSFFCIANLVLKGKEDDHTVI
jgi:hypothetical protein